MTPLEKSILEDSGLTEGSGGVNLAQVELAHAEEMIAVWEVFQASLVDDIEAFRMVATSCAVDTAWFPSLPKHG